MIVLFLEAIEEVHWGDLRLKQVPWELRNRLKALCRRMWAAGKAEVSLFQGASAIDWRCEVRVYIIVGVYQGIYDGVYYASRNREAAESERDELVRQVVGRLCPGEDVASWPMDDVWAEYDQANENDARMTSFHLEEVEV